MHQMTKIPFVNRDFGSIPLPSTDNFFITKCAQLTVGLSGVIYIYISKGVYMCIAKLSIIEGHNLPRGSGGEGDPRETLLKNS